MQVLEAAEAQAFLQGQIAALRGHVAAALSPLEAKSALSVWIDTIRGVEEFINLPRAIDDDDNLEKILSLDLRRLVSDPRELVFVTFLVEKELGKEVAARFRLTALQAAAMFFAFASHGVNQAAVNLQTVGHAIGYFQSRRRAMVSMAYTIPSACKGTQRVAKIDGLNVLLTPTELYGVNLTSLHRDLMLAKFFRDFELTAHNGVAFGNRSFEPLDARFLEPERASLLDVMAERDGYPALDLEFVDPHRIFSAAELRNDIRILRAAYSEFDLEGTPFGRMAKFVDKISRLSRDDYYIELKPYRLDKLAEATGLDRADLTALVHKGGDYVSNTNVYAPLISVDGAYVTTVTLLSRFMYYWKNDCLNKQHRFKVRSGFIFEEIVRKALEGQGFTITPTKRINGKEFDVVTTKCGVIYNLQCKNNLVDLSSVESATAKFVRYNRYLNNYYKKALLKEEGREELLKGKLGLSEIRHFVISRFAIATDNPRIISFNRIAELEHTS